MSRLHDRTRLAQNLWKPKGKTSGTLDSEIVLIEGRPFIEDQEGLTTVHRVVERDGRGDVNLFTGLSCMNWLQEVVLFSIGVDNLPPVFQVSGTELDTEDLCEGKSGWRQLEGKVEFEYDQRPGLVAHRKCWELLQGISKEHKGRGITPQEFWEAALKARDHRSAYFETHYTRAEHWRDRSANLDLLSMWSLPSDVDLKTRFQQAYSTCIETGHFDIEARNELWSRMRAWYFFEIDE